MEDKEYKGVEFMKELTAILKKYNATIRIEEQQYPVSSNIKVFVPEGEELTEIDLGSYVTDKSLWAGVVSHKEVCKPCSACEGRGEITSKELYITGVCGHCSGTGVRN